MMSELGRETVAGYAAAKGGLKMLTKNICSEFGGANIQCNGIGPGYIATQQTAPLRERQADGSRHPFDQFIIGKTPAGRWGKPEDLAGPAVFLASEASDFVNGHILYVDGGILAYIGKQPYFELPKEENPAMGMRALRISLSRPAFFRTQLRALYSSEFLISFTLVWEGIAGSPSYVPSCKSLPVLYIWTDSMCLLFSYNYVVECIDLYI